MALASKISRLPRSIRDELNRRMDDGAKGPELLPWLNALPEVQAMLAKHYNGVEISDQNLSNWRETGFAHWQDEQRQVAKLKRLTELSLSVADKADGILKGARAISAGHVMTVLESLDEQQQELMLAENPENYPKLIASLAAISSAHSTDQRVGIEKDRVKLAREKGLRESQKLTLEREKMEITAAKALLKHAQSKEVQAIIGGKGSNADKIAALRARMFPTKPTS